MIQSMNSIAVPGLFEVIGIAIRSVPTGTPSVQVSYW